MTTTIDATLLARAQHACELCGAAGGALEAFVVPPSTRAASIVVCGVCAPQLASGVELGA